MAWFSVISKGAVIVGSLLKQLGCVTLVQVAVKADLHSQ